MSNNIIISKNTISEMIESITKSMIINDDVVYATSHTIAKHFNIKHDDLLKKIRRFESYDYLVSFGKISERNRIVRGRFYPYYELNEEAFLFICLSINGKKAEQFKLAFIESYKHLANELATVKIKEMLNEDNRLWIEHRAVNKTIRKDFTDTIKDFVNYAKKQGSKNADYYYTNITKLINDTLPKQGYKTKNSLNHFELEHIENLEDELSIFIDNEMSLNTHYKKIFQKIKSEVSKVRYEK